MIELDDGQIAEMLHQLARANELREELLVELAHLREILRDGLQVLAVAGSTAGR